MKGLGFFRMRYTLEETVYRYQPQRNGSEISLELPFFLQKYLVNLNRILSILISLSPFHLLVLFSLICISRIDHYLNSIRINTTLLSGWLT